MAKKNLSEEAQGGINLHEYNAPVYNINVAYVDKQINGDYYEYNYGNGKKAEGKGHMSSYPFVSVPSQAKNIVDKILSYMEGKDRNQAKDIMMPVRAAQDAGVIRRITFEEMSVAFPEYCPKCKSSVSKYTKEDVTPYINEAFNKMVEEFKLFLH